jgi:hypothetical protein
VPHDLTRFSAPNVAKLLPSFRCVSAIVLAVVRNDLVRHDSHRSMTKTSAMCDPVLRPTFDSVSNLLETLLNLSLDALGLVRASLRAGCTLELKTSSSASKGSLRKAGGSLRREYLDSLIPPNEKQLRQTLKQ